MEKIKKITFLFLLLLLGCKENNNNFSGFLNINVSDNNIYMVIGSVVGLNDYIIGVKGKNDNILAVVNPYDFAYVNCFLENNETQFLIYNCKTYQNYCDNMNCIKIKVDENFLYISKTSKNYLYEQSIFSDIKYVLGEFEYNGSLYFLSYDKIKELK